MVEVVTLAVHDYVTLKFRDRDSGDEAVRAMTEAKLEYLSSKGKAMQAKTIRVKPPAIRRRDVALRPFYQAVEDAFPNVEIVQKHRTKGGSSASTFLVECAAEGADEFMPVATVVMWRDIGTEIVVTDVDCEDIAPDGLVSALRKLTP